MFDLIDLSLYWPHFDASRHAPTSQMACADAGQDFSPHSEKPPIQAIIAHCVGFSTLEKALKAFWEYKVSAHYVVSHLTSFDLKKQISHAASKPQDFLEDKSSPEGWEETWQKICQKITSASYLYPESPPVLRLVQDKCKAFHAGISTWGDLNTFPGCQLNLNSCTLGIEFHCPDYAKGNTVENPFDFYKFGAFTANQKTIGIDLAKALIKEHQIPSYNVLAHSTIAPGRKTDPGPYFPWKEWAQEGLGYLPDPDHPLSSPDPNLQWVQDRLYSIGFKNCPRTGVLCLKTYHCLNSYRLQFLPTESDLIKDPSYYIKTSQSGEETFSLPDEDFKKLITEPLLRSLHNHFPWEMFDKGE